MSLQSDRPEQTDPAVNRAALIGMIAAAPFIIAGVVALIYTHSYVALFVPALIGSSIFIAIFLWGVGRAKRARAALTTGDVAE